MQITHRGVTDIMPIWSADGQQIAFLAADHSAHFDVYVVDIENQTARLLQRKLPHDGTIAWRPDPLNIELIETFENGGDSASLK